MKLEFLALGIIGFLIVLSSGVFISKRIPRKLKTAHFNNRWKELQKFCRDTNTWPEALIAADKLLDDALKKRRFKGKSMGERMVAAQRRFTNNDSLWYSHNLCKKAIDDANLKLKENEVKQALIGIRQALKDLGAFDDGESRSS